MKYCGKTIAYKGNTYDVCPYTVMMRCEHTSDWLPAYLYRKITEDDDTEEMYVRLCHIVEAKYTEVPAPGRPT